ncbi:hypothetical protein [Deinococcus ficus]|uniref:Uncharacterized protein n=1 Tax=Deinococcus ficus TaxID=317577 RepID=A0A221T302_9DEIO|nr:hypothetical protein [Deinococcus ficus]ASN83240.1 hypothetical protein DFI_18760 [Deinococcus ficus]
MTQYSERTVHTVLNLAFIRPRKNDELAKLTGLPIPVMRELLRHLVESGRMFDTRSRRETHFHTVVTVAPGQAAQTSDMLARILKLLARHPNKMFTAKEVAHQTGTDLETTVQSLSSGVLQGNVRLNPVGALRLYGLAAA